MSADASTANAWWTTLRHGGVIISPLVLDEALPHGPTNTSDWDVDKLRRAYLQFTQRPSGDAGKRHLEQHLGPWLDAVLETFLGHTAPNWQKGPLVGDRFRHTATGGSIRKPNRVLTNATKEHEPRFILLVDKDRLLKDDDTPGQIGVHGGRRTYGQLLGLMRATNVKLGILTNGFQFRLVFAGLDTDAWIEWNAEAWFEGGDGRRTLDGFRALLGVERVPPSGTTSEHPLLDLVEESRKRQADLSHVMGTQVREAVELLLRALDDSVAIASPEDRDAILAPLRGLGLQRQAELDALYQAAIRVVMRLVVTAYAESRDLFPISQPAYLHSYSLDALFRELQHAKIEEGLDALAHQEGAWPRLVSHARLVHAGTRHPSLQMVSYGGRLFESPGPEPTDPVMAGLAALESPRVRITDATVQRVLELLKIGKFKANRGKWLTGPVDFSDLRTEYIGMMYEGLLDFQLREAREEDGGIVFVNLGEQPALPLRVLSSLSDDRLKKLITELKKKTKGKSAADEGEDESDDAVENEASDDAGETDDASDDDQNDNDESAGDDGDEPEDESSVQERFEAEVQAWAERAVRLNPTIFLSAKARKEKDAAIRRKEEQKAARRLVLKAIRPGGTYLVRWSGTRKGSGTFYTKPALAVPTVNRTLEPLAYDMHEDGTRTPKTPDEILGLKVCDPAMGSGSFLVAALRFLTQALNESFEHHVNAPAASGQPRAAPLGENSKALYSEVLLPLYQSAAAGDGPDPTPLIESRLKRSVVERCIYGVDLNSLAVELGKLSLWIETMDPKLTFAFLDHKIKCGNSLIGAWQIQAEHYPLGAWERELGDGKNNPRTKRLKRIRKELIVPEMQRVLDAYDIAGGGRKKVAKAIKAIPGQRTLAGHAMQPVQAKFVQDETVAIKKHKVTTITAPAWDASPEEVAVYTRGVYVKLHDTFDAKEQEAEYLKLLSNEGYQRQKFLLDLWCAAWFWPIRAGEVARLDEEPLLTPNAYYAEREKPGSLGIEARAIVQQLAEKEMRFFHWEIEYPEIFDASEGRFGFDAVVGNPPWETAKPQDNEFFTQYDPAYRTYGKQDGLKRQKELFTANTAIEEDFWNYQEGYKSQSNFVRNTHALDTPRLGGAKTGDKWLALTRDARKLTPTTSTPYAHQGSGIDNLYKQFAERALAQVQPGGRIGLILPSGIYSDYGTRDLRTQLYDHNTWEWVYSFENRRKIFDIDSRFKFAAIVLKRGGRTASIRGRFYEHDVTTWSGHAPTHVTITREQITKFSPDNQSLLEVQHPRDLEIIQKIYDNGVLLGALNVEYVQGDYNMTNDSEKFRPVNWFEERGYKIGRDSTWEHADGRRALPLMQGSLMHQANPRYSGEQLVVEDSNKWLPKFLVDEKIYNSTVRVRGPKLVFRDIAPATNRRTAIAAVIPDWPSGNKTPIIQAEDELRDRIHSSLNSYCYDFALRSRLQGTALNWYILVETVIPLNLPRLSPADGIVNQADALELNDAAVAAKFDLTDNDMRWILRPDNADPRNLWRDYCERLKVLEAAGKRGRWYTLGEAREIRRKAGMKVDF